MNKPKVIVGMSGGVDSSVSAWLLQQQGYEVAGMFMKNWEEDDTDTYCSATADMADAQAVCDQLGIELHKINFATEYWDQVFTHFLEEYRAGRTPNPDVLCNQFIKFDAFLKFALDLGADYIAMGHYAQQQLHDNYLQLLKGVDPLKDQSYFLHRLNQYQLSKSLFPLGKLHKTEVREIAAKQGFPNASKKDSTGICFIGERKFKTFLQTFLPAQSGEMVTVDGEVIGKHDGLMYYTIGQRQGLGIGGLANKSEEPWYVVSKDLNKNRLIVAQGEHPALYAQTLIAADLHWIAPSPPALPLHCAAKIRYRQADQTCVVTKLDEQRYQVAFTAPQRAITPGQSVVFYQGDDCLGGGIIQYVIPA
jgi:tRNA-specific 2-thiouridylase